MTTYVQARTNIVGYLNLAFTTAYPTIPIFYENTTQVDLAAQPDMFVIVELNFVDTDRLVIDPTPLCESVGELAVRIFARDGTGLATTLSMTDYLHTLMSHQQLSGVTMKTAFIGRKSVEVGWMITDLIVPYSFYQ